ncbi:MAG: hypothetical protein ABEH58_06965, partial [Haloplanus sp.]
MFAPARRATRSAAPTRTRTERDRQHGHERGEQALQQVVHPVDPRDRERERPLPPVVETRTVTAPSKPYAAAEDHLTLVDTGAGSGPAVYTDDGDPAIARILHVELVFEDLASGVV